MIFDLAQYRQKFPQLAPQGVYIGTSSWKRSAWAAAAKLLEASFVKKRKGYIYVNNRLEGCAPLTIEGILPRKF